MSDSNPPDPVTRPDAEPPEPTADDPPETAVGDLAGLDGCPECGHPLTDFGDVLVCDVCGFPQ